MTILVALTGVIKSDTNTPVREGRYLLEALIDASQRVVLMSDEPEPITEHWLVTNGIKGYAGILTPSVDLADGQDLRVRQIAVARAMGHVSLVVDADPEVIKHCLDIEVPSLLMAHPKLSRPSWRPDGSHKKTWAEIQQQLDTKKIKEHLDG